MSGYPGYNSGRYGPPQPQYHQQPQGNYYPYDSPPKTRTSFDTRPPHFPCARRSLMLLPDELFVIMDFITNNIFTSIDPNLHTAVATRRASLLLSRRLVTNNSLPNSSTTQGLLLLSSSSSSTVATTNKDLLNLITARDLVVCYRQCAPRPTCTVPANSNQAAPLLLLQHLSNSVMALPIATTSDTRTAPAGEKLFSLESTTSISAVSSAAASTMFAT